MNRYQSIVDNVVSDISVRLEELLAKVPEAHWTAKDDKLIANINGEELELTFERGDPLTEALLLVLNHSNLIISALRSRK